MYLTAIIDLHTRFVFERKQILLKADKIYFAKNHKSGVPEILIQIKEVNTPVRFTPMYY
jgi:hypothetical protein